MHKIHIMATLNTTPPSVTQVQLEGTAITASAGAPPFWGSPHNSTVTEKNNLKISVCKIFQ
jgi:hypothetical protein